MRFQISKADILNTQKDVHVAQQDWHPHDRQSLSLKG